jgi:acyl dehydratase
MRIGLPAARRDFEVVAKRESKSRGDAGIIETHHELHNQNGDLVFQVDAVTLVRTRPSR